jgi:hypothetical protein
MNINKVLFTGNPTEALELLKAGSNQVVNITLANNERYTDEQGNEHEITTYADVKVWGKAAQSFAKFGFDKIRNLCRRSAAYGKMGIVGRRQTIEDGDQS